MEQEMFDTQFDAIKTQQPNGVQWTSNTDDQEIDRLYSVLHQVYEVVKADSTISVTELTQLEQMLDQLEKQLYSSQIELQQTDMQTKHQKPDNVHKEPLAERTMTIPEISQVVIVLEQLQHVLETQPNTVSSKSQMLTEITELLQHVLKTLPASPVKEKDKLKQVLLRLPPMLQSLPCASKVEVQKLTKIVHELIQSRFSNNIFSHQSLVQNVPVVKEFSSWSEQQDSHSSSPFGMLQSFGNCSQEKKTTTLPFFEDKVVKKRPFFETRSDDLGENIQDKQLRPAKLKYNTPEAWTAYRGNQ